MSFLKKILGDKKKQKPPEKKRVSKSAEKSRESEAVKETPAAPVVIVDNARLITGVIRRPHITEKSSDAAKRNAYVFSIFPDVNKMQVKHAVEARYHVHVESVRTIQARAKIRQQGRQIGWKQGVRKAVVTIRKGESIELQ